MRTKMRSLTSFGLVMWLFFLALSSCSKDRRVQDEFLGEYNGMIGVSNPLDSASLIYEQATLLVEKASKKQYRVSSPTHPSVLPEALYAVEPALSSSGGLSQVAIEEAEGLAIGTLLLSQQTDSIRAELSKGLFPHEIHFLGAKE